MSSQLSRLVVGPLSLALAVACGAASEDDGVEMAMGESEQALVVDISAAPLERNGAVFTADLEARATATGTFDAGFVGQLSTARHTCEGRYCTCTGDPECNDMFSGSDCAEGPNTAVCQIRDDVPRCRCTKAAKAE